MLYSKSVLVAVAASVASAMDVYPEHQALRRELLEVRQTAAPTGFQSSVIACASSLASVYTDLPSPPEVFVSYEMTATVDAGVCDYSYPASISSAFTKYESSMLSWYSDHSKEIKSILSNCPQYSSSFGAGHISSIGCSTTPGGAGKTAATPKATDATAKGGDSSPTGTASGTAASASSTSGVSKDSAFVGAAALAVAGVLGAAIAL